MTTVLKLGGSVVTKKDEPETVDESNLERAAAAVSNVDGGLVVVHGGGSFGHYHASEHDVSVSDGTHDDDAVRAIHGAMMRLNDAVVESLADSGSPAVPIQPLSCAVRDADGDLTLSTAPLRTLLEEGFVPVVHGDVVAHRTKGATILSGDELVVSLARALDADRVGVCSAVPGVYDADGEVVGRITALDEVADAVGESDATDVTGGMAAKVRALLALDADAFVFDIDGLEAFVDGEQPGTKIG